MEDPIILGCGGRTGRLMILIDSLVNKRWRRLTPDRCEPNMNSTWNAMVDEASDDDEVIAAERAIEAARVYAVYEAALRQCGLVDFGDLVALPIKLLREHPEIREHVRTEKKHMLVDEYQNMNRASGVLLQELCAPGRGTWVVGDVRQSIYRFRGASPLNVANCAAEFPGGETTDLFVNYRSGGRIVRPLDSGRNETVDIVADPGSVADCRRCGVDK